MPYKYFVILAGMIPELVIIGQYWAMTMEYQINWHDCNASICLPNGKATIKLCEEPTKGKEVTQSKKPADT